MTVTDHSQLNLGALRSSITLTLHTHHAARLWQGRIAQEGQHGILGMGGYLSVTHLIKQASANDDPFADWAMLELESKLLQAKEAMTGLSQQVERLQQHLPTQIDVGDNLNIHPVTLPLFIASQLGFLAVYLLTDYDTLVRRALLAHHTALIGRTEMERCIDSGAHHLRSLFAQAQRYRYSGITRSDIAVMNARAREAIDKFGLPPQDVLEGTRRSRFAPPIIQRAAEAREVALGHDDTEPQGVLEAQP